MYTCQSWLESLGGKDSQEIWCVLWLISGDFNKNKELKKQLGSVFRSVEVTPRNQEHNREVEMHFLKYQYRSIGAQLFISWHNKTGYRMTHIFKDLPNRCYWQRIGIGYSIVHIPFDF